VKTVVLSLLLLLASVAAFADGPDPLEAGKIGTLIAAVENLQGAVFIRNGSEHTPREAAEHLRLKLGKAGRRVRTAEDFIRYCASRSSLSGKPYLIRYEDGTTVTTDFLEEKFAALAPVKNQRSGGKP